MGEGSARVCAVITEQTTAAVRPALQEAAAVADLAELRLDYLRDFDFKNVDSLGALLSGKPLPVIITCRAVDEGGRQEIDDKVRLRLLVEGARRFADYCDIEAAHYQQAAEFSPDHNRLIVSYHNFAETPANLDSIYDRMTALSAGVHKIVTRANDILDCLALFRLLDRARKEHRRLIALAVGPRGVITRVLSPSRGGFLTYGSLGKGRQSADGQPSCRELTDVYRIRNITSQTRILGIIGNPIGHSASPAMHNRALASLGLDFVYMPFEVADPGMFFERLVRSQSREADWPIAGLSVTIPHKTAVIDHVDAVTPAARQVGAVNTVVIRGEQMTGHNTEIDAAVAPLANLMPLDGESCAVIGAGGAARAVVCGLTQRGARTTVYARNVDRARELGMEMNCAFAPLDELSSSTATVVINATPIGMRGHSEGQSPVPRAVLSGRKIVYDLVYNPPETQFLKVGRAEGAETIGGLAMLVAQAALQFELWTGKPAPIALMHEAALEWIGEEH